MSGRNGAKVNGVNLGCGSNSGLNKVKKNFTPCHILLWSSPKITSDKVRAKSYPLERTVGRECGKNRCEVCGDF